jgi:hypothetical protein
MPKTNNFLRLSFSALAICGVVSGLVANTSLNTHAAGVAVTVGSPTVAIAGSANTTLAFTSTGVAIGGTIQILLLDIQPLLLVPLQYLLVLLVLSLLLLLVLIRYLLLQLLLLFQLVLLLLQFLD